jgi:hypothetical protein
MNSFTAFAAGLWWRNAPAEEVSRPVAFSLARGKP